MSEHQIGVIIESGLVDWQILQQDATGFSTLELHGRWVSEQPGVVEVRVVAADTSLPIDNETDWQSAVTEENGSWQTTLRIPAGGLYRLETHFLPTEQKAREWATRGDMRHFWGVGDLWVIAGQSNSSGWGRGPVYNPPELGLHLFRNSENWALASHPLNDSTDTAHPANREDVNSGHSPYLHFARMLKQQLGYPIGLLPTALGKYSPLQQWNPTEEGDAKLYHNMLHCIERVGGRVKGILWYQGEWDCDPTLAETYAERFKATVEAWRTALKQPDLSVLTVQLNRFYPSGEPLSDARQRGWSIVREAQRQAVLILSHLTVVPTLDLPLSDMIHNAPSGNMILGDRMARAALSMVYHCAIHYKAPDVHSARLLDDGKRVELTFEHVGDRMDHIDHGVNAFVIEDETGSVPIAQVTYPLDATIQLVLKRPLIGQAVVHGAFGHNPPAVPVDMNRLMPMLGFYGLPVV